MKPEQIKLNQTGVFSEFLYLFCLILRKIGLGKKNPVIYMNVHTDNKIRHSILWHVPWRKYSVVHCRMMAEGIKCF